MLLLSLHYNTHFLFKYLLFNYSLSLSHACSAVHLPNYQYYSQTLHIIRRNRVHKLCPILLPHQLQNKNPNQWPFSMHFLKWVLSDEVGIFCGDDMVQLTIAISWTSFEPLLLFCLLHFSFYFLSSLVLLTLFSQKRQDHRYCSKWKEKTFLGRYCFDYISISWENTSSFNIFWFATEDRLCFIVCENSNGFEFHTMTPKIP